MTEMCSKCGYADYIHDIGITCNAEDFIRRLERERIIDLIDQKHTAHEGDETHNESGECTACEVIELIKGENE
jgi:hypothetical protein